MSWVEDAIASMQGGAPSALAAGGGSFPARLPADDDADNKAVWDKLEEQLRKENEAADKRNAEGLTRAPVVAPSFAAPDQNSAGIQAALGNAPSGPAAGNAPFSMAGPGQTGVPPSVQLAASMSAPPHPPPQPGPQPPMPAPPQAFDLNGNPAIGPPAPPPGGPPAGPAAAAAAPQPPPEPVPPATDISARRRTATAPMSIAGPPPAASPGFDRSSIANALLGMGGSLQGDNTTTLHLLKQQQELATQAQTQNLTAKALLAKGVDPVEVAAAVHQPELLKALVAQHFGKSKYKLETIKKDEFGGEVKAFVNSEDPTDMRGLDGKPMSASSAGAGGDSSAYLAKGVTAPNHELVGEAYLQQYSPGVQAAVKAYASGASAPTGNPRKGWAENIKKIAQKYGDDTGQQINDQSFYAKKAFTTSLGDTKSGVGLQAKGFQQGLEHMANLSDDWIKAKQAGGFGIEPIANWENYLRGLSSKQRDIYNSIGQHASTAAGEIGKLFSGSQGGGVHERAANAARLGNTQQSGPAAAGSLQAALDDMEGGLRPLEARRDELFHGKHPDTAEFEGPAEKANIARIRANIARLRGEEGTAPAAADASAPAVAVKPGKYVWTPDKGLVPK